MAATHFRPASVFPAFFVALIAFWLAIAHTTTARTLVQERPSKPAELPETDLPLLPKLPVFGFPQHHPQLRLPPYPIIPPFLKPGFHTYLPKLPELPALPSLPSLPKLPELPTPSTFTPVPVQPEEGESKRVSPTPP